MDLFQYGDCKDACIGTLLQYYGVLMPEVIIFRDLNFTLRETEDTYRTLALDYRVADYLDEIAASTGIRFETYYARSFADLREQIRMQLTRRRPVLIVVDHFEYPHSHFYQSGHMPHYLILLDYVADRREFTFVDPFPFYRVRGVLAEADLARLCDSPPLLQERNVLILPEVACQKAFAPQTYLRETWQAAVSRNIHAMLDTPGLGDKTVWGVRAIRQMADCLEDWLTQEGFSPYEGKFRKFPVNSFLDVGGNRAGHRLYLRRLEDSLGEAIFLDAAERFKKIASYWDMVSSLRHLYQEKRMLEAHQVDSQFIVKKLKRIPALIRLIADAEEEALWRLRDYLKGRGSDGC